MIIFIPAYDEPTQANLDVVQSIIPATAIALLEKEATRLHLWHHLKQEDNLFAMSHGESDSLSDNNTENALEIADSDAFTHKKAFVCACFTANDLGFALKKQNSIYWGYTGRIAAPSNQPIVMEIFSNIFDYILTHFSNCSSDSEIEKMLEKLKQLCDEAAYQLDEIIESGTFVEGDLECYNCLQHLWSRLRVHHFNISQPIKHIGAIDGNLYNWK